MLPWPSTAMLCGVVNWPGSSFGIDHHTLSPRRALSDAIVTAALFQEVAKHATSPEIVHSLPVHRPQARAACLTVVCAATIKVRSALPRQNCSRIMTVASLELLPRRGAGRRDDEAGQHGDEGRASGGSERAVPSER